MKYKETNNTRYSYFKLEQHNVRCQAFVRLIKDVRKKKLDSYVYSLSEDIQLAAKEIIGPEMKQLISYFPNVEEIEVRCPLHIDYLRLLLNAELKTIKKISYEPETPKYDL
ncbi:hypothetical protein BDF21DRAFT_399578 [Thamnidium elegans]|nr:hypothetical protein BDF21DRAFT_399578 [Thamnidium elegans]